MRELERTRFSARFSTDGLSQLTQRRSQRSSFPLSCWFWTPPVRVPAREDQGNKTPFEPPVRPGESTMGPGLNSAQVLALRR